MRVMAGRLVSCCSAGFKGNGGPGLEGELLLVPAMVFTKICIVSVHSGEADRELEEETILFRVVVKGRMGEGGCGEDEIRTRGRCGARR